MIGRERELEKLDCVLRGCGRAAREPCSCSPERRASARRGWPRPPSPRGTLACLRGAAAERGASPYAPDHGGAPSSTCAGSPTGSRAGAARSRTSASSCPSSGRHRGVTDRETLIEAVRCAFETIAASAARRSSSSTTSSGRMPRRSSCCRPSPKPAEEWPLLVLGAYRSEEIPRGHPLRRAPNRPAPCGPPRRARRGATRSRRRPRGLAARVLDGEPGPTLRAALYDRTQGVPFFVEELAAALRAGGRLAPGPRWPRARGRIERPDPGDASRRAPHPSRGAVGRGTSRARGSRRDRRRGRARPPRGARTRDAGLRRGSRPRSAQRGRTGTSPRFGTTSCARRSTPTRTGQGAARSTASWARCSKAAAPQPEARRPTTGWPRASARARSPLLVEAARRSCEIHAYRDAASAAPRGARDLAGGRGRDEAGSTVLEELGRCAQLCGEFTEAGRAWEEVADGPRRRGGPAAAGRRLKRRLATVYELEGARRRGGGRAPRGGGRVRGGGRSRRGRRRVTPRGRRTSGATIASAPKRIVDRALQAARRARRSDLESQCLSSKGFLVGRAGRREEGSSCCGPRCRLRWTATTSRPPSPRTGRSVRRRTTGPTTRPRRSVFDEAIVYCQANDLQRRTSTSASVAWSSCWEPPATGRARSSWRAIFSN